jgi:uncharacterized alpha-E superfamily protein
MAENIIRANFSPDTWKIIYDKQAEMQKEKMRRIAVSQAIEVLLKDAYLRKDGRK